MGRYKEFLIEEQMRITGNWREQDHVEYLAWRKDLENQEQQQIEENEYGDSTNGDRHS